MDLLIPIYVLWIAVKQRHLLGYMETYCKYQALENTFTDTFKIFFIKVFSNVIIVLFLHDYESSRLKYYNSSLLGFMKSSN